MLTEIIQVLGLKILTKYNRLSLYMGIIFRELVLYIKNWIRGIFWNWLPVNLVAYWSLFLIKQFERLRGKSSAKRLIHNQSPILRFFFRENISITKMNFFQEKFNPFGQETSTETLSILDTSSGNDNYGEQRYNLYLRRVNSMWQFGKRRGSWMQFDSQCFSHYSG